MRTTYADENLTIKGAYSDVREDTDGNEYILIDKEIPQGNKDVSFNLSQSVKEAAENVTVKYYKNEIDRANDKNAISGNNWHREVIKPGDNFYYLRVTCADGSGKDYTVKVCGVRYVTFYFMSFVSSGKDEDGYNVYQYESIGESTVLLENDYFDIDSLYASIDENKVIIDENRNVYEKGGDYMVPFSKSTAASASFSLFCADKTFIDAQKAEVELYKDLFELTYSGWTNGKGNQWLLRFKADSAETNLVVPSEIFGDRVVLSSDSFRNAANLQSVIFADGFTSLPDRLFANGCASLESVTIPASITSAYSLGDWMFSEDLKDQLTIYCEGDIESDTWNRVPGQMAFFRTYINQEGVLHRHGERGTHQSRRRGKRSGGTLRKRGKYRDPGHGAVRSEILSRYVRERERRNLCRFGISRKKYRISGRRLDNGYDPVGRSGCGKSVFCDVERHPVRKRWVEIPVRAAEPYGFRCDPGRGHEYSCTMF